MISVEGLTKTYGAQRAVDGLTFEVPAGGIFGFIGPNGAGKTTTIRMLATLLEPDGGEARVAGRSIWDDPEGVRRAIGYLPDDFGVYPGLRVDEYLDFFAAAHGLSAERRRTVVADVLTLTDLASIADKRVETLSRGMRQRLGLGHALVHDPQVLLLDEPASGLDPRARIELRELLRELARMGKTVLISSHILTEMAELCTMIGIIERGRLLAFGTPQEILKKLAPSRRVRLRFAGAAASGAEVAAPLLRAIDGVTEATVEGTDVHVLFEGEDTQIHRLLRPLVERALPLVAVMPESHDLEQIFLRVTKGELA